MPSQPISLRSLQSAQLAKIGNASKPTGRDVSHIAARLSRSTDTPPAECSKCSDEVCKQIRRSSVYSQCCMERGFISKPPGTWPLIVSATPRSGTLALAELLNKLGLNVHHDWDSPSWGGIISWIHIFNEKDILSQPANKQSLPYFGPGKLNGGRFDVAFHLVRDPLNSITSLGCTEPVFRSAWSSYVRRHVNIDERFYTGEQQSPIGIGMSMWLEWHRFLDSLCIPRFRIEDVFTPEKGVVKSIFEALGRSPPSIHTIAKAIKKQGGSTNSRKHRATLTWKELLVVDRKITYEVFALARSYGYAADVNLEEIEKTVAPNTMRPQCGPGKAEASWAKLKKGRKWSK